LIHCQLSGDIITPAIKYLNIVIPAKAGIQEGTGCRIKSGMTELDYLVARLIKEDKPPVKDKNTLHFLCIMNKMHSNSFAF